MKTIKKNHRTKTGFTLIELLISLSIFVVFLGILSTSYMSIVRSQRQANDVRKMYSEVRGFMDSLAQDMRLGTIDYDCYRPLDASLADISKCPPDIAGSASISPEGTSTYLVIIDKDKTLKTVYRFQPETKKIEVKKYVVSAESWAPAPEFDVAATEDVDGFKPLISDNVSIENLTFAVYPAINPYSHDYYQVNQSQFQPKVTVFLTAKNGTANLAPFELNLQTTLSSRIYTRSQ